MKRFPSSSLIIATYNWPSALELTLLSVQAQSVLPDEVIIADDGSTQETQILIQKFQSIFQVPLIVVRHEDDGFRLAEIRNKAICKSTSDYIIQIDGDIILHPHFVKDHLAAAQDQTFLTGSRVWLNEQLTADSQHLKKIEFKWYARGIKNRLNAMRIPILTPMLKSPTREAQKAAFGVRGCNMSFWKKDLFTVNGYDENMVGWGREDSEICVRLINAGLTKSRIKFGAIQFHQYHKMSTREGINVNEEILNQSIEERKIRCENGLSNHCEIDV